MNFFTAIKSFFSIKYSSNIVSQLKEFITNKYDVFIEFLSTPSKTDRSKFTINPPTIELDISSSQLINRPDRQLMTLAHEFGHFLRHQQGIFNNPHFFSALKKYNDIRANISLSLSFKEIYLILKEEFLASFLGRIFLKEHNINISLSMTFYDLSCLFSHCSYLFNHKIESFFH